jgi:UDPglucose 6-dehydrogenase
LKEGCHIVAYDPAAMDNARKAFNECSTTCPHKCDGTIEYATDSYAAARNADALLILTDWPEFVELNLDQLELKNPLVIDGRNLYDPKVMANLGFTYYSVGRPIVRGKTPEKLAATE